MGMKHHNKSQVNNEQVQSIAVDDYSPDYTFGASKVWQVLKV